MKKLLCLLFLSTAAFAQHSVTLQGYSWAQGTGDPATSFLFSRSATSGGPYTALCGGSGQGACPSIAVNACGATGQPLCPSYVDLTVAAGQTYFYVVQACNSGGNSGFSNETKAVVPFLQPTSPSGLQNTAK